MFGRNPAGLLKTALQGTGFVRRGSAFFRVWGDGVLQVLKFTRQRGDKVQDLYLGLFSMYGKLNPAWFTSSGCIPRCSIVEFVDLRFVDGYAFPHIFTQRDDGQFFYKDFPVCVDSAQRQWDFEGVRWRYWFTPEQQIRILTEKTLPWLNAMTTQSLAAQGMYRITPIPNDSFRFYAHLAAGEWSQAEQTMAAILKQHEDARASWKRTFPPEQYAQMIARNDVRDAHLIEAYKMVQERDEKTIFAYIQENFSKNSELAKFCMK